MVFATINVILEASLTLIILFSEMLKFLKYTFFSEIFLGRKIKNFIEYLRIYHLLKWNPKIIQLGMEP